VARIDDLKAKREFMWDSMQLADPDKRAPLMNQWRALDASIAELESKTEKTGDPVDEIAARRAARGGATARPGRAARGEG
jgi:hypothetical protein